MVFFSGGDPAPSFLWSSGRLRSRMPQISLMSSSLAIMTFSRAFSTTASDTSSGAAAARR